MNAAALRLRVNGQDVTLDAADARTPLIYVLRNSLGLAGVRYGCGAGACGACAVLADGLPTLSCEAPAEAFAGKALVTAEGLGATPAGRAMTEAFLQEQAGQCGYCLPGLMARAMPMLEQPDEPERSAIAAALADNLCRCGAHDRILRAVALAWRLHRRAEEKR